MTKPLAAIVAVAFGASAANADSLPHIASINLCTDQLAIALADPTQILGLGPFSRDPSQSYAAEQAKQFRQLSGEAEDVLVLHPDIVLAGDYTKRETRELLKSKGLRVEEFSFARSITDVKDQIRRMGELLGHPERAAQEIAQIDAAIADARNVAAKTSYRVLPLSRRGWVTGGDSLANSLLTELGLRNAASELGFGFGGFASLETIISLKPDLLMVSDNATLAQDEGEAFLLHPALEKFYPPSKRIALPDRLTVCGGPMIVDALKKLMAELKRVAP